MDNSLLLNQNISIESLELKLNLEKGKVNQSAKTASLFQVNNSKGGVCYS